jgi:hypothetical protein
VQTLVSHFGILTGRTVGVTSQLSWHEPQVINNLFLSTDLFYAPRLEVRCLATSITSWLTSYELCASMNWHGGKMTQSSRGIEVRRRRSILLQSDSLDASSWRGQFSFSHRTPANAISFFRKNDVSCPFTSEFAHWSVLDRTHGTQIGHLGKWGHSRSPWNGRNYLELCEIRNPSFFPHHFKGPKVTWT